MSKEIKISKTQFSTVDDEDYEYLNKFVWYYNKGYAEMHTPHRIRKPKTIRMHRLILGNYILDTQNKKGMVLIS